MIVNGIKKLLLFGGIFLATFAALWCISTVYALPVQQPTSSSNRPIYENGYWRLEGIVQGGVLHKTLLGESLDLLQVHYGSRKLWAVGGIAHPDGTYESLVNGVETQEELRTGFLSPRYITLQVPGSSEYIDPKWCQNSDTARCRLTQLVEASVPGLLLEGQEQYTNGLSNIFINTGNFPEHYLYGFLTWQIEPGKILRPEWKEKW
jgi:hypothetical protein